MCKDMKEWNNLSIKRYALSTANLFEKTLGILMLVSFPWTSSRILGIIIGKRRKEKRIWGKRKTFYFLPPSYLIGSIILTTHHSLLIASVHSKYLKYHTFGCSESCKHFISLKIERVITWFDRTVIFFSATIRSVFFSWAFMTIPCAPSPNCARILKSFQEDDIPWWRK